MCMNRSKSNRSSNIFKYAMCVYVMQVSLVYSTIYGLDDLRLTENKEIQHTHTQNTYAHHILHLLLHILWVFIFIFLRSCFVFHVLISLNMCAAHKMEKPTYLQNISV